MRIAAFLDRDGTLNQEQGYIRDLDALALIPGAAQAIRKLNDAGVLTVLTTNQTGPARGYYDEAHVHALNAKVEALLASEAGGRLDAVFYCPHLATGSVPQYAIACDCRKPETGMIRQALARLGEIDLARSYVLGDKASDVEFGKNAGCQSVLLKTGYGERVLAGEYQVLRVQPDFVCADITEAVEVILKRLHAPV